jgi:hypothetical protein
VARNVRQPPRLPFPDQQTEHAVAARWVPDRLTFPQGDPLRHELDQVLAVAAEHTQRAILRADKFTGGMHYPGENVVQLEVCADRHHGVKKRSQTPLGPVRSLLTTV